MIKRTIISVVSTVAILTATLIFSPNVVSAAPYGSSDCTTWVRGIDVSNWQGNIDWSQVPSSGIAYAWSKTTQGTSYTDPYWIQNAFGAASVGIPWGGYHYATPNDGSSPETQAEFFVNRGGMAGTLPGMLDLEETGGLNPDQVGQWAQTFLRTVQNLTGKQPILYVGAYFGANLDYTAWWPNIWPLMLPSYTAGYQENVNPCFINTPRTPAAYENNGTGWSVWQYSSSGLVAGISGHVDMNVMTPEFFQQITGIGTAPAPVPVADQPYNAPWQVYKIGSKGPGVSEIQRLLNNSGINVGPVDGVFGQQTAAGVAEWQSRLGLTPDGVWGTDTQQATDDLFAWLNSQPVIPPAPDPNTDFSWITDCTSQVLRQGASGGCVVTAQALEANKGAWIAVDGIFGPATQNITIALQANAGLYADGVIGPDTWNMLINP